MVSAVAAFSIWSAATENGSDMLYDLTSGYLRLPRGRSKASKRAVSPRRDPLVLSRNITEQGQRYCSFCRDIRGGLFLAVEMS